MSMHINNVPIKKEAAHFLGKAGVKHAVVEGEKVGAKAIAKVAVKRGAGRIVTRMAVGGARIAVGLPVAVVAGAGELAGHAVCKVAGVKNKHAKNATTIAGAAGGGAIAGAFIGGPVGAAVGAGAGALGWGVGKVYDLIVDSDDEDDED